MKPETITQLAPARAYGVGCVALDLLCTVDRYPGPDEKTPVNNVCWQGGGLTATALAALARLGVRSWIQASLGDDDFSRFLAKDLEAEGIDTSASPLLPGGKACFSIIIVDEQSGSRTIFYSRKDVRVLSPREVREDLVRGSKVVLVDTVESAAGIRAAQIARANGIPVVLDAEQPEIPGARDLLSAANILIPSARFAVAWTGTRDFRSAARLLFAEFGKTDPSKVVVVTAGAEGAFGISAQGECLQPAFRVPVVDTTGCGDVFHGAFAYGLIQGWPLARNLRFACAVAALKCRAVGGRAGIPGPEEVEAFLSAMPPEIASP